MDAVALLVDLGSPLEMRCTGRLFPFGIDDSRGRLIETRFTPLLNALTDADHEHASDDPRVKASKRGVDAVRQRGSIERIHRRITQQF